VVRCCIGRRRLWESLAGDGLRDDHRADVPAHRYIYSEASRHGDDPTARIGNGDANGDGGRYSDLDDCAAGEWWRRVQRIRRNIEWMAAEPPRVRDCIAARSRNSQSGSRRRVTLSDMQIDFRSGELRLEGEFETPAGARGAAVICHPHPLYGGNMHNNVVLAIDEALRQAGFATLRFNFRGVGRSGGGYENGVGEQEDARAAVEEVLRRTGLYVCTLAGYSFGAMMAANAGAEDAGVERLVVVAPPLSFGGLGALVSSTKRKLFVVGDRDSYCAVTDLTAALKRVAEPKRVEIIAGADHFFGGYEDEITAAVRVFTM
jgi:alpha/beta superfamily hydrolase